MRKLAVSLCLCLTLTACAPPAPTPTATPVSDLTAGEVVQAIVESQSDAGDLDVLTDEALSDHLSLNWGLGENWEDGAVSIATGMDAREIGVALLTDGVNGEEAAKALEEYRQNRLADFVGYAPEEAARLENAAVLTQGRYLILLVCGDTQAAQKALSEALAGDWTPAPTPTPAVSLEPEVVPAMATGNFPPFDPPNDADMTLYDTTAILAAWATGDEAGLSEIDAAILARCREVLTETVNDEMTAFEKELALHDWLVDWGSYDQSANATPDHSGQPENNNPYGMLVSGYGICLGYATTFQLLMDLAGVECITVVGASSNSTGDHAWNMVRLDGEWYCVDPTWDDPTLSWGGEQPDAKVLLNIGHRYFNVTSQAMRDSNHQWDYENVPEATATAYRWDGVSPLPEQG